jgi:signal peptidase II
MRARRWPGILFYGVLLAVLAADQAAKAWATAKLAPVESVAVVPGFFSLTYVRNPGIAFGLFAGQGWVVAVFMAALAGVAIWFARELDWRRWQPNVLGGLLLGGALGNLLDRWRQGQVVDFLDFYVGRHHWPAFNVADSMICIAVGFIVLGQVGDSTKAAGPERK